MLDYFIKVLLFQAFFLAAYDLFLKRETFFQINRGYLLLTSCFAYVIPLLSVKRVQRFVPETYQAYITAMPEVLITPSAMIRDQFSWSTLLLWMIKGLFVFGMVVMGILFVIRLYKLRTIIATHPVEKKEGVNLVWMKYNEAYSFFRYIFIGVKIPPANYEQVITHEMVHVRQYHSIDLLFFEIQKMVAWFNPFSYLYQNRIAELHEFIADEKAVKYHDKSSYFNHLLSYSFGVDNYSFVNPFLKHSLIKKRIIMLNKKKSNQLRKLKYLLLIPILGGMLLYTSCEKEEISIEAANDEVVEKPNWGAYFYIGSGLELDGELIKYEDLSPEEKAAFDGWMEMTRDTSGSLIGKYEIFKVKNDKKYINYVTDEGKLTGEESDMLFALIEDAPIFPGCTGTKEEMRKCLQDEIRKHINKKFNSSLAGTLGLAPGRKRLYVQFTIDKTGNISDIKARGPHGKLEEEAKRVISLLPKMVPGKQHGQAVGVKYTLPITLQVADMDGGPTVDAGINKVREIQANNLPTANTIDETSQVQFAIVENAPVFPGCTGTVEEIRRCFQDEIRKHINEKYNTGFSKRIGLPAGRHRVLLQFLIDRDGTINHIVARGSHEQLEAEAIRVVKLLPKMTPAKHHGKNVGVMYTLPITLQVEG
ncbi:M56 family metallopeptidase [Flavobacteriaceae bacterium F08102]|nr:M56 family metallopeptidase [Flavobacteriaceae bacterium F08102]